MIVALAGCAAGIGLFAGCAGPLEDSDARTSLTRLRRIEPLRLEEFKKSSPAAGDAQTSIGAGSPSNAGTPSGLTGQTAAGGSSMTPLPGDSAGLKAPAPLAGSSLEVSLESVRAGAVRANLDLKASIVDPSIAKAREDAERAKFEAVFRSRLDLSTQNNPTLNTTQVNSQQSARVGAGVDVPLRTGGRVSVDVVALRSLANNPFLTSGDTWTADTTLSISQPLLRSAGEAAATASIRIAAYQTQIAEAGTRLTVISTLAQADRAYWNLYAARRELEVRLQQLELAQTQLEQAKRRVEAGSAAELEITRAESGVATRLEAIVIAETNVVLQQRELKRLANLDGLDVATATQIKPTNQPIPLELDLDREALLKLAVEGRDELLQTELQLLADAVGIDLRKNAALPKLDATGQINLGGLNSGLYGAVDDITRTRFKTYTFGLSGEVPLGNQAAESRVREAVLTRIQRLYTRASRSQTVRKEVLDATDRIRSSWQRILAARQAAILAERTLNGERRQFEAGSRTSTDVLDAAARLADAQSSEIRALTDYEIAKVDLAVATGTTLGAVGVVWEPEPDPVTSEERRVKREEP